MYIIESLCCTAVINTTLEINYTSIKKRPSLPVGKLWLQPCDEDILGMLLPHRTRSKTKEPREPSHLYCAKWLEVVRCCDEQFSGQSRDN